MFVYPGEKDRANTRLARALVGTTRISAEIRKILTVQHPVTPKRAGASGSKIKDDGVSTFKQACSGRYSGSLKLRSRRFERTQNRSAPFLTLFSKRFGVVPCSNTREILCKNRQQETARARVPFLPGREAMRLQCFLPTCYVKNGEYPLCTRTQT